MKKVRRAAFTLIELLVVVAIIALLLSVLLPSLAGAREQGKKAVCLSNLGNLGKSLYQYSTDDRAEQLIPIHRRMLTANPFWEWRTSQWFTWGGRSAVSLFYTTVGTASGYNFSDDPNVGGIPYPPQIPGGAYSANQRPLNVYMFDGISDNDKKKMEWFHCPSDRGYPDDPGVDDGPRASAERPLYNTLGNSYRASLATVTSVGGGGQNQQQASSGMFSRSAWGHRASTLVDTGKMILCGEPTFFNMIGRDDDAVMEKEETLIGWHKRKLFDNLLFCDGSARTTKAELPYQIDYEDTTLLNSIIPDLLDRSTGATWRITCYPTPGALIWDQPSGSFRSSMKNDSRWPYAGAQDNFRQ